MRPREPRGAWRRLDWIAVLGGAAAVLVAALFNPVEFLARPASPRGAVESLVADRDRDAPGRRNPDRHPAHRIEGGHQAPASRRLAERQHRSAHRRRAQFPVFIALALASLILAKTVLQLGLYALGYSYYSGDDVGRTLRAAFWLSSPTKMDWAWTARSASRVRLAALLRRDLRPRARRAPGPVPHAEGGEPHLLGGRRRGCVPARP